MLNAVKSQPTHSLWRSAYGRINIMLIHCTFYHYADADQNWFSQGLLFHCMFC